MGRELHLHAHEVEHVGQMSESMGTQHSLVGLGRILQECLGNLRSTLGERPAGNPQETLGRRHRLVRDHSRRPHGRGPAGLELPKDRANQRPAAENADQALGLLRDDLSRIARTAEGAEREALGSVLGRWDAVPFLNAVERELLEDRLGAESLRTLIALVLLSVRRDASEASPTREAGRSPEEEVHGGHAASVC